MTTDVFSTTGKMKLRLTIIGTIGSLLLCPSVADAQTPISDVRCLILSNVFAKQGSTEEQRKVSQLTSSFFLGRIDGRSTPASLKAAMIAQKKGIAGSEAGKAMQACVAQAGAANGRMATMARQHMPTPPPSILSGARAKAAAMRVR